MVILKFIIVVIFKFVSICSEKRDSYFTASLTLLKFHIMLIFQNNFASVKILAPGANQSPNQVPHSCFFVMIATGNNLTSNRIMPCVYIQLPWMQLPDSLTLVGIRRKCRNWHEKSASNKHMEDANFSWDYPFKSDFGSKIWLRIRIIDYKMTTLIYILLCSIVKNKIEKMPLNLGI
jgi:hypothetical protein